jgi:hypothetical protein
MDQKGFLASLFDFSFSEYITMKVIRVLYMLIVILVGIVALFMLLGGLMALGSNPVQGLLTIILAPVGFLLYVVMSRVYLELVMVIFKIGDNTEKMANGGNHTPPQV